MDCSTFFTFYFVVLLLFLFLSLLLFSVYFSLCCCSLFLIFFSFLFLFVHNVVRRSGSFLCFSFHVVLLCSSYYFSLLNICKHVIINQKLTFLAHYLFFFHHSHFFFFCPYVRHSIFYFFLLHTPPHFPSFPYFLC